jgi:hypothetical protein
MSCGCQTNTNFERNPLHNPILDYSNPNALDGKFIVHSNKTVLKVLEPILDSKEKNLIGFVTKNQEGKKLRIFAEDVISIR